MDAIDIYTKKMNWSYEEDPQVQELVRDVHELDRVLKMKNEQHQHQETPTSNPLSAASYSPHSGANTSTIPFTRIRS